MWTGDHAELYADDFKLSRGEHRAENTASPGEILDDLFFEQKIFDADFTVKEIKYESVRVKTEPVSLTQSADGTDPVTDTGEPVQTEPETEPSVKEGGLPPAAKIGLGVAAAAAAAAVIAAILKKKRK